MDALAAALIAAAAIVLIRMGWGGARALALAGWALLLLALAAMTVRAGAWGIAVVVTGASIAALGVLSREAWLSKPSRGRPPREPASVTLPHRALGVGRRLLVFVLVVPVGLAVSQLFALGAEAAAVRAGWSAPDRTALAFFATPIAWSVLASLQMTRATPLAMIPPTLLVAAAGALLWWPL